MTTELVPIDDATSAEQLLPDGWRWVRLGEVCDIISGQSPPGETYRNAPEGLPFFQGKADFGSRHPVPRTWCIAPKKIALPGDILISVRAPVGPTNVADVKCCIGRGLAAIRPRRVADRDFILAALQLYERDLARLGSGSTFQAISRDELTSLRIPLPPLPEQRRIAAILSEQMAAVEQARKGLEEQLDAINRLPFALLRRAFAGELATDSARLDASATHSHDAIIEDIVIDAIPVPQPSFARDYVEDGLAIAAYAVNRLHARRTFGRVQLEKILYFVEADLGILHGGIYERQAVGPFDKRIYRVEGRASKRKAFQSTRRNRGTFYTPGPAISTQLAVARRLIGDKQEAMDRLLDLFSGMNTEEAEIFATLFAAWNDFLLDGVQPTDEQIIREVRENWHPSKERFEPAVLQETLDWMRQNRLIPRGMGPRTQLMVANQRGGT